jgi:hypothetical protein
LSSIYPWVAFAWHQGHMFLQKTALMEDRPETSSQRRGSRECQQSSPGQVTWPQFPYLKNEGNNRTLLTEIQISNM